MPTISQAPTLSHAPTSEPSVGAESPSNSNSTTALGTMSSGVIAAVVIGIVTFFLCVGALFYYFLNTPSLAANSKNSEMNAKLELSTKNTRISLA